MKKIFFVLCFLSLFLLLINSANVLGQSDSNPALSSLNVFCSNYQNIIRNVFGTDCTGDMTFLLAIGLWFVFLFLFFDGIASFSPFSRGVSFIIAIATVITLSFLGHFEAMAKFIVSIITTGQGLMIFIASLVIFLILYILLKGVRAEQKKKLQEFQEKMDKEILHKTSTAVIEGLKKQ